MNYDFYVAWILEYGYYGDLEITVDYDYYGDVEIIMVYELMCKLPWFVTFMVVLDHNALTGAILLYSYSFIKEAV